VRTHGHGQADDDPIMKTLPYISDDANPEHFLNELYELYDMAAFEHLTDDEGTVLYYPPARCSVSVVYGASPGRLPRPQRSKYRTQPLWRCWRGSTATTTPLVWSRGMDHRPRYDSIRFGSHLGSTRRTCGMCMWILFLSYALPGRRGGL
jgi:hypothetical protein